MAYRNKTYIAGDWDHDYDAVERIYKWKESNKWSLDFHDAHAMKQARDTSLPCSIKRSLKDRLDSSKQFVLIVGDHTNTVTKGSCHLCSSYNNYIGYCARGYSTDKRSFIKYECEKAVEAGIDIVVLYNNIIVDKSKCPLAVRYTGKHIPMVIIGADGEYFWDYYTVKEALGIK